MSSAWLIGDVHEGMRHIWRQEGKAAFGASEYLVADPDLVSALQGSNVLPLVVMHMERRAILRCNSHYEVIERPARFLTSELESQFPARFGPDLVPHQGPRRCIHSLTYVPPLAPLVEMDNHQQVEGYLIA